MMVKNNIRRLRLMALLEGLSLLVLLFIAMPIKYIGGNPEPVRIVGMVHGVLFILFVILTLQVSAAQSWKWSTTAKVLLSSFIPFGNFYVDRKILQALPERR